MRSRPVAGAAVAALACAAGVAALVACSAFSGVDSPPGPTTDEDAAALSEGGVVDAAGTSDAPGAADASREGMIAVQGFFIDSHEVTLGEYDVFALAVKDGGAVPIVPPAMCVVPAGVAVDTNCRGATAEHPATCVSWCNAYAYCKYRGKRLCGAIGGGAVDPQFPSTSQWSAACGPRAFPYGPDGNPSACNTKDRPGGSELPIAVGTLPGCAGGAPGLFDMSGNVWEWEDSCKPPPAGDGGAICSIRGGSSANPAVSSSCGATENHQLTFTSYNVGFRCCADP